MKKINEHNQNPNATFSMRMNQFGDMVIMKLFISFELRLWLFKLNNCDIKTSKEFAQKFLNRPTKMQSTSVFQEAPIRDIPVSIGKLQAFTTKLEKIWFIVYIWFSFFNLLDWRSKGW